MRSLRLGLLALALAAPGLRAQTSDSLARQVREADGRWRVVFDKGCDVRNCTPAP